MRPSFTKTTPWHFVKLTTVFFLFILIATSLPKTVGAQGFYIPSRDPNVYGRTGGYVEVGVGSRTTAPPPPASAAAAPAGPGALTYHLLEKVNDVLDVGKAPSITEYINAAFSWFLTLIAVISILLLIVYGIAYASTTGEAMKSIMKGKLTGVMYGVGIGLSAWLLLQFVNPQINNGGVKSLDDLKALMPKATGGGGSGSTGGGGSGGGGGGTGGGGGGGSTPAPMYTAEELARPRQGGISTFAGPNDTFGIGEARRNGGTGLAFVNNKSDLPAAYWRNDPSSPNLFADLNPNALYFAMPTSASYPPGTKFVLTNEDTGDRVIGILVDKGPNFASTGAVVDLSPGMKSMLNFNDYGKVSIQALTNQSTPVGYIH